VSDTSLGTAMAFASVWAPDHGIMSTQDGSDLS